MWSGKLLKTLFFLENSSSMSNSFKYILLSPVPSLSSNDSPNAWLTNGEFACISEANWRLCISYYFIRIKTIFHHFLFLKIQMNIIGVCVIDTNFWRVKYSAQHVHYSICMCFTIPKTFCFIFFLPKFYFILSINCL